MKESNFGILNSKISLISVRHPYSMKVSLSTLDKVIELKWRVIQRYVLYFSVDIQGQDYYHEEFEETPFPINNIFYLLTYSTSLLSYYY